MEEQRKDTRRRGEILEEAILLAAKEELAAIGYSHLTMESVAARAGTNKAVLYRRWANKSELVMAAVHKYIPKLSNEIPNTGNLREDIYSYLCGLAGPAQSLGAQTLRGLMSDPSVWSKVIAAMPHDFQPKPENKVTAALTAILKNAELRGEVHMEKLPPRILSLPWNLMLFELFSVQEVPNTVIAEIVDDIFLPLVRLSSQSAD